MKLINFVAIGCILCFIQLAQSERFSLRNWFKRAFLRQQPPKELVQNDNVTPFVLPALQAQFVEPDPNILYPKNFPGKRNQLLIHPLESYATNADSKHGSNLFKNIIRELIRAAELVPVASVNSRSIVKKMFPAYYPDNKGMNAKIDQIEKILPADTLSDLSKPPNESYIILLSLYLTRMFFYLDKPLVPTNVCRLMKQYPIDDAELVNAISKMEHLPQSIFKYLVYSLGSELRSRQCLKRLVRCLGPFLCHESLTPEQIDNFFKTTVRTVDIHLGD